MGEFDPADRAAGTRRTVPGPFPRVHDRPREDLVASLMVDALSEAAAPGSRHAALVSFVGRVGADEAAALRSALDELEAARGTSDTG